MTSTKFNASKRGDSFDAVEVACVFTLSHDTTRSALEAFLTDTSAQILHIFNVYYAAS